jgi:hypothetical protein
MKRYQESGGEMEIKSGDRKQRKNQEWGRNRDRESREEKETGREEVTKRNRESRRELIRECEVIQVNSSYIQIKKIGI